MNLPICIFDAKNALLCPRCEAKLEDGSLTRTDVDASIKLARLAKTNQEVEDFVLSSCREIEGNLVITLAKKDIVAIRQSRTLYRLLQDQFDQKIWLVEDDEDNEGFIEDLFFPTKVLTINPAWAPGGIQKTKAVISGRHTSKFPIDTNEVIQIAKNTRNLDIEIEFEEKAGR